MSQHKGGRGKRAPYETVVIRVPKPVLPIVEEICDNYRKTEFAPEQATDKPVTTFEDIREKVDQWRKTSKVGKDKLQNLLQLIYGVDFLL